MKLDGYIICGTPRTGSTLLCRLLAATGAAGEPDSFYGRKFMPWWASQWNLPDAGTMGAAEFSKVYLQAAIRAGRAGTRLFGLRLMRENLDELCTILDQIFPGLPSDIERLENAFGRLLCVHLSRENKLAQAVSLIKAEQTGLWHMAPDGTEIERLAPHREPHYDFERIRHEVATLERHDAAWTSWFNAQRIVPLHVRYEALSTDPQAVLSRVCQALGIHVPAPGAVTPGVARLSDEISLDWMRRYRLDLDAAH